MNHRPIIPLLLSVTVLLLATVSPVGAFSTPTIRSATPRIARNRLYASSSDNKVAPSNNNSELKTELLKHIETLVSCRNIVIISLQGAITCLNTTHITYTAMACICTAQLPNSAKLKTGMVISQLISV